MKLKKSVIAILISSSVIILACMVYFTTAVPFLNFMFNTMPKEEKSVSPIVVSDEDSIIDQSQYGKNQEQESVNATDAPSATPEAEQLGTMGEMREQTYVDFTLPSTARNVLVLGLDNAANLTDTIFIVSIDDPSNTIKVISIPRDTYVRYSDTVLNAIERMGWINNKGIHKINIARVIGAEALNYTGGDFDNRGINFLCAVIEQLLGETFKIDDYVAVDFDGFEGMIDVFGGIWMTVEEDIYNQYGELLVPAGRNYLTPKQAFHYVRARKRYDQYGNNLGSTGDTYRKEHQTQFIKEMISQYVTKENISKAPEILTALTKCVYHSVNTLEKLSKYTDIATNYVNKKYYVDFVVITGEEIDPFNDGASYVEIHNLH